MRHFGKFPPGVDYENLIPLQKEFIMLLVANIPSYDDLGHIVRYHTEKQKILETDYRTKVSTPTSILMIAAKQKSLSLEDYMKHVAEDLQEKALSDLDKKYNITPDITNKSTRAQTLEQYNKIIDHMEKNETVQKVKNIHNFFEGPK